MTHYLLVSPRGFSNEAYLLAGSAAEVAEADAIISDNVNAWAQRVPASHSAVRTAKRDERRYGADAAIQRVDLTALNRRFGPEYL